ncbi:MAG: polyphenol oxidase family protein [Gemmatimonadota bacterium]
MSEGRSGGAGSLVRFAESETRAPVPGYVNRVWEERFPGLVCGITAAGREGDFGLARAGSVRDVLGRYGELGATMGFSSVAVPFQVHGSRIRWLEMGPAGAVPIPPVGARASGRARGRAGESCPALTLVDRTDGLLCGARGVLLAVTAADCVPVYLLEPRSGTLGLLHAGWRGTAAGVLEAGLTALASRCEGAPASVWMHLGPAICGECYEVGEEVLRGLGRRGRRDRVDLRGELVARACARGVEPRRVSVSTWCTRCERSRFHSYRGSGETAGRMAAYMGWGGPACGC